MAAPLQCFLGTYEGELFGWTISPSGAASVDASHELTCAVKAHDASMRTSTTVRRGNSSMLLTSASDGSVKIYDLRASREVGTLLVEADAITVMRACGPDHVLTGHEGGFVRLWRTSDWSDVLTFRVHKKSAINDIAPHPSARVALSVGRDRSLRLIDLTKGKVVAVQDLGGREPREVRYAPDGASFAVLFDSEVVVHDASTAEPRTRVALPDSVVKFVSFAFLPTRGGGGSRGGDDCCLAIGCEGGALLLASLRDGSALALHQTGHAGRVRCVAATAAAADALLFTLGADAVVLVWDAAALLAGGASPPAPSQRLLAAKGFRGTCLTLVETPAPARLAPPTVAGAAAASGASAGPGGGATVLASKKTKEKAQQRPSATSAGSAAAASASAPAAAGAAAVNGAARGPGAPPDPAPQAPSGSRPEKRKRRVAFASTD